MVQLTVTLSGLAPVVYDASDEQFAGLGQARSKAMSDLPDTEAEPRTSHPDYCADDATYLQWAMTKWHEQNAGATEADASAVIASALNSWSGAPAPATPSEESVTEVATKASLRAYASDKRWRVETGGMVWNGITVPTDDRSKLLLLGAAMTLTPGATAPLVINGVNYGTLTGAQFKTINEAIVAHVQATFPKLATALAGIEAGTITSQSEIDALLIV